MAVQSFLELNHNRIPWPLLILTSPFVFSSLFRYHLAIQETRWVSFQLSRHHRCATWLQMGIFVLPAKVRVPQHAADENLKRNYEMCRSGNTQFRSFNRKKVGWSSAYWPAYPTQRTRKILVIDYIVINFDLPSLNKNSSSWIVDATFVYFYGSASNNAAPIILVGVIPVIPVGSFGYHMETPLSTRITHFPAMCTPKTQVMN